MRYYLSDGTPLVLVHHTPAEWAARVRDQLLRLGCSTAYAARRYALLAAAGTERKEGT